MIDLYDYVNPNKKYYIYGTTNLGGYLYEKIVDLYGQDCILGFLETRPISGKCFDKNIFSPDEIRNIGKEVFIILASAAHFEEMRKILISCGVSDEQIIVPYKLFDYFKTLFGIKGSIIKKVCFWPPISGDKQDLIKKIAWFIPDRIEISVWCDEENLKSKFNKNVYVESITDKESDFQQADIILLWDRSADKNEYNKYISKVFLVDPYFYRGVETLNYSKLYYHSFSDVEKKKYENKSKKIFVELKKKLQGYSVARIFCSGPSIDEIYENTYLNSINIICNSMVKGKEWLKRNRPDILAFTDLNYYFSPTEYCRTFFEDVLEGARLYDYYIVIYEYEVPLLLSHYPELGGRVIGIKNDASQFTYPSERELRVRETKNILTETMIPLASSLCDGIEIAGATGRNPDETFFWKHNGRMQYLDLMHTIFEMYPSLFRDQNYANYYEYHCQCMEGILKYGERLGKKYINLTTSYIPALKERTVKAGEY